MKQKNYTTSQDFYHFHLISNFINMIELQGDEMGGKYIVIRDVRISWKLCLENLKIQEPT